MLSNKSVFTSTFCFQFPEQDWEHLLDIDGAFKELFYGESKGRGLFSL